MLSAFRPREPRTKVFVPCRLNLSGAWGDACIHNVSSRGLLIAADQKPQTGDYIEVRRGTLVIIGRVMWRKDRFFGVRTQDRVSAEALTREARLTARPGGGTNSDQERRTRARLIAEGRAARRAETSRHRSSALQYAVFAAAGCATAIVIALEVHDALASPFTIIDAALARTVN
ncbi:PilZ domain-containing protein [uncultured Sphingomonas sp.]|uniref:PilZ domain-containing protein n=1 Tax=Sphingomonas sp. TaxID=28214 RepID=UPI00262ECD96|nr:PilZ domain-containing protein [uncultured Sphingomonas sp.]